MAIPFITTRLRWVAAFAIWSVSMALFGIWAIMLAPKSTLGVWPVVAFMISMFAGALITPKRPPRTKKCTWRWGIFIGLVFTVAVIPFSTVIALDAGITVTWLTFGLMASLWVMSMVLEGTDLSNKLRLAISGYDHD